MNQEKLGQKIKEIRVKNNLTQALFAQKFHVSPQAVSKWEIGKNIPDVAIILKICEEFKIDLNELLDSDVVIKRNKTKKFKILSGLIILVVLVFTLLIYTFVNRDEDFSFKTVTTNVENFSVYGTVAYNDNKTIIYISNLTYEGVDNNKYIDIRCVLYENEGDVKRVISSYDYNESAITLADFLKKVNFNVNDSSSSFSCKSYDKNTFHLEIETVNDNHQSQFYKVPLILEDVCN